MTINDPPNDVGKPPPLRFDAKFVVYSDTMTVSEISLRLGLEPTRFADKGPRIGKRTGQQFNIPHNMWMLSSEFQTEVLSLELQEKSLELDRHLRWLLLQLLPISDQLQEMRRNGVVRFCLCCVVWASGDGVDVKLSSRVLEMLVELKLEPEIQFADYGPDY